MKKEQEELSYEAAYAELQQLLAELQEDAVGIDELAAKVERARQLVSVCRDRLRQTETVINKLLEE